MSLKRNENLLKACDGILTVYVIVYMYINL